MGGNKALKRAWDTNQAYRLMEQYKNYPILETWTVWMTPEKAKEMLQKNKNNRPVNFREVEKYKKIILAGQWRLIGQGIVVDKDDNILTGQTRLMAIMQSGIAVPLSISRGTRREDAHLLDRGRIQTGRDLGSRETGRPHSPEENSLARGIAALRGKFKPTHDDIGAILKEFDATLLILDSDFKGIKKSKAMKMILAAIGYLAKSPDDCRSLIKFVQLMAEKLDAALMPLGADRCWGKGAAFGLAMKEAKNLVCTVKERENGNTLKIF